VKLTLTVFLKIGCFLALFGYRCEEHKHDALSVINFKYNRRRSIVLCNAFTPTHKVLDFKHASQ